MPAAQKASVHLSKRVLTHGGLLSQLLSSNIYVCFTPFKTGSSSWSVWHNTQAVGFFYIVLLALDAWVLSKFYSRVAYFCPRRAVGGQFSACCLLPSCISQPMGGTPTSFHEKEKKGPRNKSSSVCFVLCTMFCLHCLLCVNLNGFACFLT